MTGPLLELEGVTKHFPLSEGLLGRSDGIVEAVHDVSLSLERGRTLGLVGESGCGKSTLARLAMRLLAPTSGRVRFDGEDLTDLSFRRLRPYRRRMQLVFQDPQSSLNPRLTVRAALTEPLRLHGWSRRDAAYRVEELLERVGLSRDHADRYPHEFSGGQRQRIGIARALATEPDLLVLDEPTSALDVSVQAQILNLLRDLQREEDLTYLFISHDLSVVRHVADDIAVMYLGRVVEHGPADRVFAHPQHPYTQALFSAIPVPDPARRPDRILLPGDVPSPRNPPQGCRFHPRCPIATAACGVGGPALAERLDPALASRVEAGHGHLVLRGVAPEEGRRVLERALRPIGGGRRRWPIHVGNGADGLRVDLEPVLEEHGHAGHRAACPHAGTDVRRALALARAEEAEAG